jgi:TonB-dependent starch-binding outer membrane protein SusC
MTMIRRYFTAVALSVLLPGLVLAQERGTVTGRVLDVATQQPLAGAQVSIAGTALGTLTNQQGGFLIPNVPVGMREVRASLIGYAQGAQAIDVPAGGTATINFQLRQSALAIEGVVVTATGELQRVRERGNTVSQIPMADIQLAPITRMSDVLQGRSAGVVVRQPSGTTGTGSRVRIRGSASASLGNQPLIVIDGIRVNDAPESMSFGVGGQTPSRLEDINPEEIESIEILKGPAAAALYGTAAATGVIQVTTRRGRAGPARWNAYSEFGALQERTQWPGNYWALGVTPAGAPIACFTFRQAAGTCTVTELLEWNPLMDRAQGTGVTNPELGPASPFREGFRQKYGLNVAGGSEQITYFISADSEDERGIFQNNNLDRISLRANVRSQIRDNLDLTLNSGWITSDLQLPWGDNTTGPIGDAITGDFEDDPVRRGYALASPETLAMVDTRQGLRRLIGSANANYQPLSWLNVVGTAGLDVLNRFDSETVPPNTIPTGSFPEGRRISNRVEISNYTAALGATATTPVTPTINSTTSFGGQYHQEIFRGTYASGWQLLGGTGSLAGTNARPAVNEANQDIRLLGTYLQQQFGFWDRLFLTGAIRGDDNSAFGTNLGLVWYPSFSASWVVNEEPWFPEIGAVNSLRLRSAVGRSGLRPRFRDAITYYAPVGATVEGRDVPAFAVGGVGDPGLRPEISTEYEGGFDLGLLDERLGLEFTYYNKRSRDALIARRLAPSLGLTTTRWENVGVVSNTGVEALINANLLNLPNATWNATFTVGTNRNRLVEMEGEPIIFGLASGQQHRVGYPLGGYWQFPYTWEDPDGNGLLRFQDVTPADTMEFAGNPIPTRNASLSSDVSLFGWLRVSAMLEHQGGHTLWNATDEWQCVQLICQALHDPAAPVEEQARAIASYAYVTWWGYLEDASFTKLREVALTFSAPPAIADRWNLGGASLTLSGRNLATWTGYTGTDPEANFAGAANWSTAEFQTQPPIRQWIARFNVNF